MNKITEIYLLNKNVCWQVEGSSRLVRILEKCSVQHLLDGAAVVGVDKPVLDQLLRQDLRGVRVPGDHAVQLSVHVILLARILFYFLPHIKSTLYLKSEEYSETDVSVLFLCVL